MYVPCTRPLDRTQHLKPFKGKKIAPLYAVREDHPPPAAANAETTVPPVPERRKIHRAFSVRGIEKIPNIILHGTLHTHMCIKKAPHIRIPHPKVPKERASKQGNCFVCRVFFGVCALQPKRALLMYVCT